MTDKKKILVTRPIPDAGLKLLEPTFDLEIYAIDQPIPRDILLEGIHRYDGLLCLLHDKIDRELIDQGENLKIIANYAVGYDNIDTAYATEKKIPVTNTPEVLTDATADLAWALMLAAGRRIVESDKFLRAGSFHGWGPNMLIGQDIVGKTLGIIGAGRIGVAVAERSAGFRMNVLYSNRSVKPELEQNLNARKTDLDTLLRESDYISVNVALNPFTRHLISTREFEIMKSNAVIVNTSRGPVIDEKELVTALKEGKIAGAGLDVFEFEPEVTEELLELDNAVLLPHIGSATEFTRNKMSEIAAKNIISVFNGEIPPNVVNPAVFEG